MTPGLGEIRVFAFGIIPRGWAACNGQLLPLAQNQALFSLLGTYYGGNGINTFALPNLQGTTMLGYGNAYQIGQAAGTETHTLNINELPLHNHLVVAVDALGSQALNNSDDYLAQISVHTTTPSSPEYAVNGYTTAIGTAVALSPTTIGPTGGSSPHENRMPFLTMNICIALQGIFPQRN
jgi:microcystin-dependent protein